MTAATLELLGPFSLRSATGELHAGRKHRALLALVACGPASGVSRPSLAALLWPDHDEESARNSLRQGIHHIRALVANADCVEVRGDRLALNRNAWDVDVWRFEQLAERQDATALVAAAQLYRGQLGDGLEAGPEWDGWLAGQRERLRHVAQWTLQRLTEVPLPREQRAIALDFAQRLVHDDPLHEGSWRAWMILLDRAGLRAKALHAWEECCRVLRSELGVAPCAQTRGVFESLRHPASDEADPRDARYLLAVPRAGPDLRAAAAAVQDHLLCGLHFMYLGSPEDNERARRSFDAAGAQAPDCADALALRAWTHFLDFLYGWNGDASVSFRRARRECDSLLGQFPNHANTHALNGKLLLWQWEFDAAVAEMELALALTPTSPYVHSNLADAYARIGSYAEALRLIERALEIEPNDKGVFRAVEGFARFHMGDVTGARTAFRSAITRHPLYCVAHSGLAAACAELGEVAPAREAAARARMNNSRYSADFALNVMPIRLACERERVARAWRIAGMPEHESA